MYNVQVKYVRKVIITTIKIIYSIDNKQIKKVKIPRWKYSMQI